MNDQPSDPRLDAWVVERAPKAAPSGLVARSMAEIRVHPRQASTRSWSGFRRLAILPAAAALVVVLLLGTAVLLMNHAPVAGPGASSSAPSSTVSTTATLMPTAESTPPSDLPLSASLVRGGIQVSVTLERNPLTAGVPAWADIYVTNVGSDEVTWQHDGCKILASVNGQSAGSWRPGVPQTGVAETFKTHLLRKGAVLEPGPIWVQFVDERFVGRASSGCGDVGAQDKLKAGQTLHQRARWDGSAYPELGLPRSGPVRLQIHAGSYWRTSEGNPGEALSTIEFEMPAWILNGRDASLLDPPEVIDAALLDTAFVDWLSNHLRPHEGIDKWSGLQQLVWFDPALEQWHVEVLTYCAGCPGGGTIHGVLVDPVSGAILGGVDHPWDGTFVHRG
jgi:hypothetical protein